MGLDYSYELYFKGDQIWDVLQSVARISEPAEHPTLIVFPDSILPVYLKPWCKEGSLLRYDDHDLGFTTSIYFPFDDAIRDYLQRVYRGYKDKIPEETHLGVPIGIIYLSIKAGNGDSDDTSIDPDLVLFDFGTPGTTMSMLFFDSASVQARFRTLLEMHQGVCGVLNMEDSGQVFWLNGRPVEYTIPDPCMSPKQIEAYLNEQDKSAG